MSHHIYHTEGFIVDRRDLKEADVGLTVFTRDFGFLYLHARSLRSGHSKMKGHAIAPGHVKLSLVRGREMWRLVGIDSTGLLGKVLRAPQKRELTIQIFSLLRRLMPGEEKYEDLFLDIKDALFFMGFQELNKEEIKNFECIIMLRILKSLGYLKDSDNLRSFVDFQNWHMDNIMAMKEGRKYAISAINSSLNATGM